MASYPIPTFDETEELLVAVFRGLFPDRNVGSRRSYHRRRLQVLAAALTQLHAHIESVGGDVMPDTSTGAFLERWGKVFGVERKGATPARKSDALLVRGDVGEAVPINSTLVHVASGLRFKITEADVIPAEGEVLVDIVAIDTGSKTRLEAGEVLEFEEVPDGLQTEAELQEDLDEDGVDIEQEAEFKRRVLDAIGEPSAGGNDADYIGWMLAIDGISQAFVYPNRAGRGTVDVLALHAGTGTDRVLLEADGDDIVETLAELAPTQVGGTGGSLRHLTAVPDEQDLEITIEPTGAAQWAFVWDDQTPAVVAAWTAGTRVLQFTTDRPGTMKAGDRICIHGVASSQTGQVLVVESLVDDDKVKLEEAPDVAPAATDIVYAGGPLTATIRDALLAHINGDTVYAGDDGPVPGLIAEEANPSVFELRVLAEGMGPANPDGVYGTWSGGLIRSVLETIAVYSRGVRKATCVEPASDYEATDYDFPDDLQVGLIIPGEVLVRKAW